MSSEAIFEDSGGDGESYYLAEDGRLFALSENIPLSADSRIQEIREIPLSSEVISLSSEVEDIDTEAAANEIPLDSTVSPFPLGGEEEGPVDVTHLPGDGKEKSDGILPGLDTEKMQSPVQNKKSHVIRLKDEGRADPRGILGMNSDSFLHHTSFQGNSELNGSISIPLSCGVPSEQIFFLNKKPLSVDDFVEIITIFKCKACDFSSCQKEVLYAHIERNHLNSTITNSQPQPSLDRDVKSGESMEIILEAGGGRETKVMTEEEGGPLNSMLIISDVDNVKYNMEGRTETVILEDTKEEKHSSSYPYFKFFLVKEQKEIFICTRCSICMSTEERIKLHVVHDNCVESKHNDHTSAINRVEVFKINKKQVEDEELDLEEDRMATIQEEESPSIVDQLYRKVEDDGAERVYAGEDYRIMRLKRNRTDLEVAGEDRVWVCSAKHCHAIFKTESILDFHVSCHKAEGLCCPECPDKRFSRWADLSLHLYKKHDRDCDLYQCIQCLAYKTGSVAALEKHCQTHTNLKLYQCNVCYKGFNQQVQLKNHSVIHLKQTATKPNWARPKKCDICKKEFSDSKSLKKHVQAVHSQLKPYICQICGYKSARKANLRLHVRQHSGEKPFQCDECEYRTGDHNSLRRHKRRHTGDKPYKCTLCSYSSIQSSNFYYHVKIKHQIPDDGSPAKKKKKIVTGCKKEVGVAVLEAAAPSILSDKRDLALTDSLDSLLALDRTGVNLLAENP